MSRCRSCNASLPPKGRFCAQCGAPAAELDDEITLATSGSEGGSVSPHGSRAASSSHPSLDSGRFLPGTMLAGRYRVVALLGRGGMGEVYRVDDLKLGQPAALKFLPAALERDESRLVRFLNEVRVALRVSHPNVCRVHDIGEFEGQHFLSMEYVDGENLGSLLRRVGRLPGDKAAQVAQQLCAGLAAAHEQGILHRDLKPANVMIDGRGQVKITDFGLAGLIDTQHTDVRSGTPAYMAPEQWEGRSGGVRSDIYALGLVLFELFTGKAAFAGRTPEETVRLHRESEPTSPASLVDDLDPGVERVILRCLEKDPEDRPSSVRAVGAALPGGNPLAAALEAGEIPSPEMVAQAHRGGSMRPAIAWAGLAAFCVLLAMITWLGARTLLVRMVPLEKSSQVLLQRARDIAKDLGQTAKPVDELFEFAPNNAYLTHIDRTAPGTRGRWAAMRQTQPAALRFWYRRSQRHLERTSPGSIGGWMFDPAPIQPGMVEVGLDPQGRMLSYHVVPSDSGASTPVAGEPDWAALFAAAGLDLAAFDSVAPEWTPPDYADRRAAWTGHYPEAPETAIRVEAAALAGLPIAFRVIEPWTRPAAAPEPKRSFWDRAADLVGAVWFLVVILGAALVALRNVRLGRGDRKGAVRLALYLGGIRMLWMLGSHHVPGQHELELFISNMAWASYRICVVWVLYLAFEPYARRLWPQMMVSWVRLLKGRIHDPLVGRDLLVGLLFGAAFALIIRVSILLPQYLGGTTASPETWIWSYESLRGTRHVLTSIVGLHTQAVLFCFTGILLLLVLRLVLRRTWLAVVLMGALGAVMFNPSTGSPLAYVLSYLVTFALFVLVLFRVGFLPVMLGFTVSDLVRAMPLTFDFSVWYAAASLLPMLLLVGLAVYAMVTALAGQPLFRDDIFEAHEPVRSGGA